MLNRVEMVIVDILFPKLKERGDIQYLTLCMSLAVYFLYVLFIRSRMLLSTPSFLWVLLMNMGWILSNAFLYILQWHYFPFLLMQWIKLIFFYCLIFFLNVQLTLHSLDKPYSVMIYYPFHIYWIQFANLVFKNSHLFS